MAATDGGLLASFAASNIKASVFITSISFAIYLAARLTGLRLRDRRQHRHESQHAQPAGRTYPRHAPEPTATATPPDGALPGIL